MKRGQAQIEITFDVDINSILNVTAVEISSGKNNKIDITNAKGRLSRDDADRLVEEAEKFEDEDEKLKEGFESKNSLEQYCYQVRQTINKKIDEVLKWVDDNPVASKYKYESKIKELERIFNPIMQEINPRAGTNPLGAEDVE